MTDRPALDLHATLIHTDSGVQIHKVVVGSFDNNVYVVRCTETSEAILIDAANEHDLLFGCSRWHFGQRRSASHAYRKVTCPHWEQAMMLVVSAVLVFTGSPA